MNFIVDYYYGLLFTEHIYLGLKYKIIGLQYLFLIGFK